MRDKSKKIAGKKAASKKITVKSAHPTKKLNTEQVDDHKDGPPKPFPVVGIGASAGGLEAFSELLGHLSPQLGMAYVFVQHLSPDHESFLPQIISRKTTMPVYQVKDKMELKKDNVYIIPPNNSITVTDGVLSLIPEKGRHVMYPVDLFLSSLARLYKANAIGIILSGTGTDGTLGMKDIKAEGGITFAQNNQAQYQGMPGNAIDMGYVDFVLSAEGIAGELASLSKNPLTGLMNSQEYLRTHVQDMEKIHGILYTKKNVDFSQYKQTTIYRRIIRRMLLSKVQSLTDYVKVLDQNIKEVNALHQDLLINVTDFFRDKGMNQALISDVFPLLVNNRKNNQPIRIWVPGCSTGEEVFTIAMLLVEFLGAKALSIPVQIFGTDLSGKAVDKARTGIYPQSAVQNISKERLQRFFVKLDGQYQVIKTIRDLCILAPHNLLKDPPFSNIDLVSCQNLLIYLEAGPQQRIMQTFHYALTNTGFLVLGKSETIGVATDLFELSGKGHKVYLKKQGNRSFSFDFTPKAYPSFAYPGGTERIDIRKTLDVDRELEKILLSQYIAPGLLINKDMEIIRFLGAVAPYLEPTYGKASFQLMKMVKEEIAYELRASIMNAKKSVRPEKKEGLQVVIDQQTLLVQFEVVPFKGHDKDIYFLVIFGKISTASDTGQSAVKGKPAQKDLRLKFLENQLKDARHTVKTLSEEYESMKEELQSSNEEALSSNEELQSINEELETSKEELQSMNEELMTINEELHKRNFELKEMGDYADAVFESKHEALLILNSNLKVRIANKGFYTLFGVSAEETEGTYFNDLGNKQWNLPDLYMNLQTVQQKQTPIVNYEIHHHFPRIGERTMLLNAQLLPLKETKESLIMVGIRDITERTLAQKRISESEERFRLLIQNSFDIITIFDQEGTVHYISPSVTNVLGFTAEEKKGTNIFSQSDTHPDDKDLKEKMFRDCLGNPGKNIQTQFRLLHKNGEYRFIEAITRNMLHDDRIRGVVANYRDITERKILEQQKDDFIGIASHELKTPVTSIKAYAQILQEDFLESGNQPAASMAQKMNSQIDRLTKLITGLLDFTHIEIGKLKFNVEKFDFNQLTTELADEIQHTTEKKIELKLGKTAIITGDRFRTGEALSNLISNALKYSPQANRIIISSKLEKTALVVAVQDFGIGIDPSKTDKIFDRFYRVSDDSINTFPGLGLGLYLAAEIVKKQGGLIWVKSMLGKGSTFYFSLPVPV